MVLQGRSDDSWEAYDASEDDDDNDAVSGDEPVIVAEKPGELRALMWGGLIRTGQLKADRKSRNESSSRATTRNRDMMALSDLLPEDGVNADLAVSSRKQALQALSEVAAKYAPVKARTILELVLERERLGSTGVGEGVAIPHARVDGIDTVYGVFARLRSPVDFDSVDGRPVDLIFMLLAPEHSSAEHLKALARVSRLLRREDMRERLRSAPDEDALIALLGGELDTDAA